MKVKTTDSYVWRYLTAFFGGYCWAKCYGCGRPFGDNEEGTGHKFCFVTCGGCGEKDRREYEQMLARGENPWESPQAKLEQKFWKINADKISNITYPGLK
jgi:hypothetical protein